MRRRRTLREVHTREAQLQQRSVVRVANSTAYVIHVNERSVFISASARGMLDYLQCAGDDPALSGMPVSYGAQLFKLHGYRAVVKLVSFPDDGYFTRLSRAALEEPWRKLPNVVVDDGKRDLVILELSREDEPRLPNGKPLFRALDFAAADTLEGHCVCMVGYSQSGPTQSGTNVTHGLLASYDTARSWLRYDGVILPGHIGAPLVVEYTDHKGHPNRAVVGYAVTPIEGELGNCR